MILFMLIAILSSYYAHGAATITTKQINAGEQEISLAFTLEPGTFLYKDFLTISCDNPQVTVSSWTASTDAASCYDSYYQENKKGFDKSVVLTMKATAQQNCFADSTLHVSYCTNTHKNVQTRVFPLSTMQAAPTLETTVAVQDSLIENSPQPQNIPAPVVSKRSWSARLATWVQSTDSLLIRLILALLLGILLSLTPCIYPMIPITAGILQAKGSRSLLQNFLHAGAYTIGIATTFAFLGLLAAFTGKLIGSFMSHPLVILGIVAMLIYFALSLFGFYEMYIPRSLQTSSGQTDVHSSYLSAFLFGMASGSIASPCLSPGLVLILSIVTTSGNALLGFFLLFFFGIGLSIPLLIIGTFSSSIALMPRAGKWMNDIKVVFGFLLLGLCFYFLGMIVSWDYLVWPFIFFLASVGIFYIYTAPSSSSFIMRMIKAGTGIALIAATIMVATSTYLTSFATKHIPAPSLWHTIGYEEAIALAQQENKKLFIAFSAPTCSMCKAIDKKTFADSGVTCSLKSCCCIKLDDSAANELIQKKYHILGFPTYVLIDPKKDIELKRWGSELYDMTHQEFLNELNKLIKQCVD